jgi:hypothetical protein
MPETGQSSHPNVPEIGKSEIGKSETGNSGVGKSSAVKSGVGKSPTSQALMNLRAFAIVTVVSFHSVLAYLASQPHAMQPFDRPPFHWMATPILDSQRWLGFDIYAAFLYVSLMPVMFFLSGIFVWPSLKRKGSWNYLTGRFLRIGVPFLFGVYLLMPFAYYPVYRVGASDPSLLSYFKQLVALPFWPSGPLWFLWQLLVFDCAAVAIFLTAPRLIEGLGRLSTSASETPKQYFFFFCSRFRLSPICPLPLYSVHRIGACGDRLRCNPIDSCFIWFISSPESALGCRATIADCFVRTACCRAGGTSGRLRPSRLLFSG